MCIGKNETVEGGGYRRGNIARICGVASPELVMKPKNTTPPSGSAGVGAPECIAFTHSAFRTHLEADKTW